MNKELIEKLYVVDSFDQFVDAKQHDFTRDKKRNLNDYFADSASAGVLLERQLERIDPRIITKQYPDNVFDRLGIQVDNTGGIATTITTLRTDTQGSFKTASDRSDNRGKISLTAEKTQLNVSDLGAFSEWTDEEVERAAVNGQNLPQELILGHQRKYLEVLDESVIVGRQDVGLGEGLANYSGYNEDFSTDVLSGLTGELLYEEMRAMYLRQYERVNNTASYQGNMHLCFTALINRLQSEFLNTNGTSMSVEQALRQNFPNITRIGSPRLDGLEGDRRCVFFSNNPDVIRLRVPKPLEIGKVINVRSWDFVVDSRCRVAGPDFLEDATGEILSGM